MYLRHMPVMKQKNIKACFIALVVLGILSGVSGIPAGAQSVDKRIDRLERQLNAVQRKVFGNSSVPDEPTVMVPTNQTVPGPRAADTEIRLTDMENQLRQMTGQMEEANFRLGQMERQLEKTIQDFEFRLNALEGGSSPSASPSVPATPVSPSASSGAPEPAPDVSATVAEPANNTTLPAGNAATDYDNAYKLLAAGKYAESEGAFKRFLETYPDDDLASNAQYWLGQSYYVRGDYQTAAQTFLDGYQKHPKSPKAPAYLLKIGITLNKLGQAEDACDVYRELSTQFPTSQEATTRLAPERQAAKCK